MQVRQTGRDKGIGRGSGFARSLFPDKKRTVQLRNVNR